MGYSKSVHPDQDGVVSHAIVRYALLKPGPGPGFNEKGPFKTKLVAVQNLAIMYSRDEQRADKEKFILKPGGSAEVSWDATKEQVIMVEKHDQRTHGSADVSVLMQARDEGTVAASHYTGQLEVTNDVCHDGIGSALYSTRDCEQQGTKKHEVQETITGHTITSMEEEKETNRRGNAPHHHNWRQQVKSVTSRTDNAAGCARLCQDRRRRRV